MKTLDGSKGRVGRRAALWVAVAASAVCAGPPGLARAQEPAPAPAAKPQARPAAIVSIRKQKAAAAAAKARSARVELEARIDAAGVCKSKELTGYEQAVVPALDPDPKKRRVQILEIASKAGVSGVSVPAEADLRRSEGTAKLRSAEDDLRAAIAKKRTAAKQAFSTVAQKALSTGGNACESACAEDTLEVCVGTTARTAEGFTGSVSAAAEGLASFQTSLVTGLAKFLQTRAEAELTTWLMTQVQRDMCSAEGKAWFPETCALVDEDSGYSITAPTSLLATAVRKDLERLPARTLAHATGLDQDLVTVVLDTLWKIHEGQKPIELVAGLGDNQVLVDLCAKGADPSKSTACVLASMGQAARLSGDAMTNENIESALDGLATDFMEAMKDHLPASGAGSGLTKESVKDFLRAARALQAQLAAWANGPPPDASTALQRGGIGLRLTLSTMDSAVAMLGDAKVRETWGLVSHGLAGASEILQGRPAEAVHELIELLREAAKKLPDGVARHLALIADLAAAKDATEVQATLEAAAAPVGSYLEKRKGPMLSATGLVGLSIGGEVPVDAGSGLRQPTAAFSPMAAVGLDLSFPVGTSTIGPFFSLVDVGQLLALPFGSPAGKTKDGAQESAAVNNQVQVAQVISPGVFLRVGIGKSPLTWGIGASYAPQLRSYVGRDLTTNNEVSRELFDVVRFQTFLAVDVTLLPLKRF